MEKKTVKAKKVAVKEPVVANDVVVEQPKVEVKKAWVNLTDDEIRKLNNTDNLGELRYARAIEQAVKAKNNG